MFFVPGNHDLWTAPCLEREKMGRFQYGKCWFNLLKPTTHSELTNTIHCLYNHETGGVQLDNLWSFHGISV